MESCDVDTLVRAPIVLLLESSHLSAPSLTMSFLRNLLALHRVDSQVRALRGRLDSAERYLGGQQRQVEDLETQRGDLAMQVRQLHAQIGNAQNEMRSFDERIAKIRNELNATTNTKQYTMLLGGLKSTETSKREAEDQEKALEARVGEVKTRLDALDTQFAERTALRDRAKAELAERRGDIAERLGELERERTRAASAIPTEQLAIFDQVAHLHEGEAMASIVTISARHREYACGACNCEIPFDSYSRLRGSANAIVQCMNCQRILHLEEVEEAAT